MTINNRRILIFLGLCLIGLFIWYFFHIVVYILLAVVISLIGRPIIKLLNRVRIRGRKIPDTFQALLTLMSLYGIGLLIFLLFLPIVIQQAQGIASIDVQAMADKLKEPLASVEEFAATYQLQPEGKSIYEYAQDQLLSVISSIQFSAIANSITGFIGDLFLGIFAVTFISFFFLKEKQLFFNMMMGMMPDQYEEKLKNIFVSIQNLLTRYFVGVLLEMTIVGTIVGIGLTLFGVKNALLIGFLAGTLNIIPYLGPILGAIFGTIVVIATSVQMGIYGELLPLIIKVLSVFFTAQVVDNILLQPLIYSSSVKAHPMEIFIVILMASSVAGIPGMIFAIPAYTIFRVFAKEFFSNIKVIRSLTENL